MHCGLPHPDLLFAVLSLRQMNEIRIYSGIEPIGWDVGVSSPAKPKKDANIERKMDDLLGQYEKEN